MSHCNDLIAFTVTLGSNWSHVGQVPCGLHHAEIVPFLLSSVFLVQDAGTCAFLASLQRSSNLCLQGNQKAIYVGL